MQEDNVPLTKDTLCDLYYDLNKQYFGKVKLVKEVRYEWARIPHFFTPFYVYKYATGLVSAINFANRILKGKTGALEKYIEFLSAGCSDNPVEILKKAGCDLEKDEAYDVVFNYLKDIIKEMKKEM